MNIFTPLPSDYLFDETFSLATLAIHSQRPDPRTGALNIPIFQSATYQQKAPGELKSEFLYTRIANPTTQAIEETIALLEQNKHGIAYSSGTAAMVAICGLLTTGDNVLSCDDIYGGNQSFFRQILDKKHGITVDFIDMSDLDTVQKSIKPNTKMIWVETPTNPTLKLVDIQGICRLAKDHRILTVVDNTFCSPYLQTPSKLGADITINSGTKYLGGHSDILYGTLTCSDSELYQQLKFLSYSHGACPSPHESYLMLRSVKTLEVRMKEQIKNAYIIASYLSQHEAVERVLYPGLRSHPQHELAKTQMRAGGAMVSFYLKGGREAMQRFVSKLKFFTLAVSLGGVESLIEVPALMTHANVPEEHREHLGISDNLIRLSAGVEGIKDLIEDLRQALQVEE